MILERVVLASRNPDKIAELKAVLTDAGIAGEIVGGLDWPEVVEDADTLEGNAIKKAREVSRATGLPAIADDTGLEVEALDGAPGVMTARFAGPGATYADNVDKLLEVMGPVADRSARFRTAVAVVWPDGRELVVVADLEGSIATERRGRGGFGYDPVFQLPDGRTLAEVPGEEKNRVSHRAKALGALVRELGGG